MCFTWLSNCDKSRGYLKCSCNCLFFVFVFIFNTPLCLSTSKLTLSKYFSFNTSLRIYLIVVFGAIVSVSTSFSIVVLSARRTSGSEPLSSAISSGIFSTWDDVVNVDNVVGVASVLVLGNLLEEVKRTLSM